MKVDGIIPDNVTQTGAVRVTATHGINEGDEILMGYGSAYWRARRQEPRRDYGQHIPPSATVGGFIAYSRYVQRWNGAPDAEGRREVLE